jgi:transcriptional regulator GlxA family with amidase domain
MPPRTRNVVILLFDEVEVLDFAGPFEVFSVTGRRENATPFNVVTVAERAGVIHARSGLAVTPRHAFSDCPAPDILVIPGGFGTRREMHNEGVIGWIRSQAANVEILLSVCTGALLLARAGLLAGLDVTTHHGAFDLLAATAPDATVHSNRRFIDNGRVITSAGISAGIDAALHVVARLLGEVQARETAAYMEYDWRGDLPDRVIPHASPAPDPPVPPDAPAPSTPPRPPRPASAPPR